MRERERDAGAALAATIRAEHAKIRKFVIARAVEANRDGGLAFILCSDVEKPRLEEALMTEAPLSTIWVRTHRSQLCQGETAFEDWSYGHWAHNAFYGAL